VWMSPECSRLSFMVSCFWHGSGTPLSRRLSDHLFRSYGKTVQDRLASPMFRTRCPAIITRPEGGWARSRRPDWV
jgi:hypothetical protein